MKCLFTAKYLSEFVLMAHSVTHMRSVQSTTNYASHLTKRFQLLLLWYDAMHCSVSNRAFLVTDARVWNNLATSSLHDPRDEFSAVVSKLNFSAVP